MVGFLDATFDVIGAVQGRKGIIDAIGSVLGALNQSRGPWQKLNHQVKPRLGSLVSCRLGVALDHTGIYVGKGKIVHRDGDGFLALVGPKEFLARLDGHNPADTIYVACINDCPLGERRTAIRAMAALKDPEFKGYNLVFKNCHQFCYYCITGKRIAAPLFSVLESEVAKHFDTDELVWRIWKEIS